jgi:hypothetical protein
VRVRKGQLVISNKIVKQKLKDGLNCKRKIVLGIEGTKNYK